MSCPSLLRQIKLEPKCLVVRVASHDLGDSTHCTVRGADEEMEKGTTGKDPKLKISFWGGRKEALRKEESSSDFWYLTSRLVDSAFAYHFTSDGLLKNLLPHKHLFIEKNKWLKICYTDHISWRTEVLGRGSKCLFYKKALRTYCSALIITGFFITWEDVQRAR